MFRFSLPSLARPVLLLTCALAQGEAVGSWTAQAPSVSGASGVSSISSQGALQKLNSAISQIVARVSPAVVQIRVTGYGPAPDSERTETAFVERHHSIGSGIIVDSTGYILTNEHLVHGAQRVRVFLPPVPGDRPSGKDSSRRRIFDAQVVGVQADVDLALLKIEATGLPVMNIEKENPANQGELVFAIGSPEGLASTVTMGIVSAVERQVEDAFPMMFIQTDAPINPGNSGGPLVDADGDLVGINTFILTHSGGSQGLGFAIPAATAKFVYDSLRKFGRVRRVEVGVIPQPITPALAAGLGLSRDWGVIVSDVDPKGAAHAAGVEPGDIIDSFDGHAIYGLPSVMGAVFLHPVDQPVTLKVLRGQRTMTLELHAPEATRPLDRLGELATPDKGLVRRLGIVGMDLNDQLREIISGLPKGTGVVVGARIQDATSAESGLQAGDVIRTFNLTRIDSLEKLRQAVHALKAGEAVALQIEREGKLSFLSFEME